MHKVFRHAAIAVCLLAGSQSVLADVTVAGKYVKFGVNDGGSMIDFNTFTGIQFDPSGTGNFTSGIDFLTPGIPFAFYSLGVGGTFAAAGAGFGFNPFSSVTGSYNAGNNTFAITSGGHFAGLDIAQIISFNLDSALLHTSVVLTNTSGHTLNNVAYGVGFDPDQDQPATAATINTILSQGSDAALMATGPLSGLAITLRNTSGWAAATASVRADWLTDPYRLGNELVDDGFSDSTLNLGYLIGPMAAGEQFALGYDYVLGAVPEPAGYATLLAGMGLLGALARRRRG